MPAEHIIVFIATLIFALLFYCTATGTNVNCSVEASTKDGYPRVKGTFSTHCSGNKKNQKRI